MVYEFIRFSRELRITNLEQLKRGTGCRYLECVQAQGGDLVAIRWRRKRPEEKPLRGISTPRVIVCFQVASKA